MASSRKSKNTNVIKGDKDVFLDRSSVMKYAVKRHFHVLFTTANRLIRHVYNFNSHLQCIDFFLTILRAYQAKYS